ncbi:5-oxoprolinase subunit PxpA [Pseudomarimonas salicorniae]|uniref:LamB/YcsF family protein n=1 Tax=Pseudomarimonas salicorniae TaxID=2933270 RepID=A0ABT0GKX1_9GAMM|nr:5-oxoprolinase subunit PxpA [Lysobacter sp. CAU 1642]MCK7594869.1 LamB/YcsF family protein [Lysobacter sp. CAU 1642]
MSPRIDINCDLGEGCASDAAVLPFISSASIACGLHAGSAATMQRTIRACLEHGVAIGAHPAFDDREHFGRRELQLDDDTLRAQLRYQLGAAASIVAAEGGRLAHVKPHGALYNLSARDPHTARIIAEEVARLDAGLRLVGLAGSASIAAAQALGLQIVGEAFAERRYDRDGRLCPRNRPGAVIDTVEAAMDQVRHLLERGAVIAEDGSEVRVIAATLCLHGDREDVIDFARALRATVEAAGFEVAAP